MCVNMVKENPVCVKRERGNNADGVHAYGSLFPFFLSHSSAFLVFFYTILSFCVFFHLFLHMIHSVHFASQIRNPLLPHLLLLAQCLPSDTRLISLLPSLFHPASIHPFISPCKNLILCYFLVGSVYLQL